MSLQGIHSRDPWALPDDSLRIVDANGATIALLKQATIPIGGVPYTDELATRANGRLIVQAPRLLDCLRTAAGAMDAMWPLIAPTPAAQYLPGVPHIRQETRLAIAAALGELCAVGEPLVPTWLAAARAASGWPS